ncbi:hypothetical protein ACQKGL_17065 [Ensifer adhaerens]|uniref:hypothetical protein n=1 Tax=Ensifer adhaerens TaxID=106592 RepID=UPI003CFCA0CC
MTAIFRLSETILGAKLFKQITLRPGHPVVYQRHKFVGGCGDLSIAHRPMLRHHPLDLSLQAVSPITVQR